MTNTPNLTSALNKTFFGYDDLFYRINRVLETEEPKYYPPHNVIKRTDNEYTIELAVAGYSKEDISIEEKYDRDNKALWVSGKGKEDSETTYVTKMISTKNFTRQFWMNEFMEVKSADIENGILRIEIVKNVPKEKQPKLIKIK